MTGKKSNCPHRPAMMARGRSKTILKSAGMSVSPRQNISKVRTGITISIVILDEG